MAIVVNLDVMMAKRKMSLGELSQKVDVTMANLSILKNNKAKAVRFSTLEAISALNLPQLGVFNLPFLNKDLSAQIDVINEVIPTAVPEMLEGTGLRLLATYSNGIRQPLLKDHPINSIEDIQGLKMRTPETKMYVDLWNALGASTVTSAWSEAYTVLQSGVADAVEADDVGLVSI